MLVITRRDQESIQIGTVTVTILKSQNNKVRLGIEAPPEVPIARTELLALEPAPVVGRDSLRRKTKHPTF